LQELGLPLELDEIEGNEGNEEVVPDSSKMEPKAEEVVQHKPSLGRSGLHISPWSKDRRSCCRELLE
jgi:hypothetical protein